ncbi:MAG: hypothetical protein R3B06_23700 [Kofleriaceae bacterium]
MKRPWNVVVVLVALVVGGCRKADVPSPDPLRPITAAQAEDIAQRFIAAAQPCDPVKLRALVDVEQLARRALVVSTLSGDAKHDVLRGMRERLDGGGGLCEGFAPETAWELLRVREVDGHLRPVLRGRAQGGINYFELIASPSRRDGAVRLVDYYIFLSGERLSETLGHLVDQAGAVAGVGVEANMEQLNAAKRSGDYAEVRRRIAALPPTLRFGKAFRLMDIGAAVALDAPDLVATLDSFARAFPGDPASDFVMIDAYFARKQVQALLEAIDRLDQRVGGDPFLDQLRIGALMLEPTPAHVEAATAAARRLIAARPDQQESWMNLASVQLTGQDYDGVVATLDHLTTGFGMRFDREAMAGAPLYQGFLASPQFAAWWPRYSASGSDGAE